MPLLFCQLTWTDCYVAEWLDRMVRITPEAKIDGCDDVPTLPHSTTVGLLSELVT